MAGEESPDSTEQGARRKLGAGDCTDRATETIHGRRQPARWLKRGNPHPLQPQAGPSTLLAEARVEGTDLASGGGLIPAADR